MTQAEQTAVAAYTDSGRCCSDCPPKHLEKTETCPRCGYEMCPECEARRVLARGQDTETEDERRAHA